jgi:hypothetical protein
MEKIKLEGKNNPLYVLNKLFNKNYSTLNHDDENTCNMITKEIKLDFIEPYTSSNLPKLNSYHRALYF